MKAPIIWLNDFTKIENIDPKIIAHETTMTGTKVEGIIKQGEEIKNVITGRIKEINKHPDADKLIVCHVDVVTSIQQIVTGADNINVGDIVPVALPGALLANNFKIKSGKLRGVKSDGMLCSIQELGFTLEEFPDAHPHGIYILPKDTPLGEDIIKVLGLNKPVIDFEITSNRPDCLSIEGLAREVAITMGIDFNTHTSVVKGDNGFSVKKLLDVEIKEEKLCNRYIARALTNVKIGKSPKWMETKLRLAGVRPINNIVDITNYVMLELGQPMHAFDYDLLDDDKIIVRKANNNESFVTLDDSKHKLDENMLVISNKKEAVAIAGIMGGKNSQIMDSTKTIILESANFEGINVRLTAKKLGIRTESSARFEKGLDAINAKRAIDRACELVELLEIAEVSYDEIDCYPVKKESEKILFRPDKINSFLGTSIDDARMLDILRKIGCEIKTLKSKTYIIPPSFRPDLEEEVDLSEEIARFYGYNNIKPTLLSGKSTTLGGLSIDQQRVHTISAVLRSRGYYEACTYSFLGSKSFDRILLAESDSLRDGVKISNPLGEDFSIMRTTMLPSLMEIAKTNKSRGVNSFKLFEIAKTYIPNSDNNKLPEEKEIVAGICSISPDSDKDADLFFETKGEIQEVFNVLGIKLYDFIPEKENNSFHPGRTAKIISDDKVLGTVGYIHPNMALNYEVDSSTIIFLLDYSVIKIMNFENKKHIPLPKFPSSSRDLAIITDKSILAKDIEYIIKLKGTSLLESIELFDVYQGTQLAEGKKSLAYNLVFRSKDKTLTDDDINPIIASILSELENKYKAKLR